MGYHYRRYAVEIWLDTRAERIAPNANKSKGHAQPPVHPFVRRTAARREADRSIRAQYGFYPEYDYSPSLGSMV